MSKHSFFPLAAFAVTLLVLSSCRKVYDFIRDHPDAHDSLCRITKINLTGAFNEADEFDISYNDKGNPTTMLVHPPGNPSLIGPIGNLNSWFKYDKHDRLLYYYSNFPAGDGGTNDPNAMSGIAFHKYTYPRPDFVTDTLIFYPGGTGFPPMYDSGLQTSISGYTLDVHGRISKVWQLFRDPHQPPQLIQEMNYDAKGNLPLPGTDLSYDDKVNPYRTNRIWQFVFNNYSRNNVVKIDYYYFTQYNEFGLPLNLRNLEMSPYYYSLFDMTNTGADMTFTYACSIPKGPIDY
jgi:hypothetical protein